MSDSGLEAHLRLHPGASKLLVVLHGHGDDPQGALTMAARIDPGRGFAWLVPTGPTSTSGGGPAWYPNAPGDEGPPLAEALAALDEVVERNASGLGSDASSCVVVGFSQGGSVALAAACRRDPPFRPVGVVGVASWLPSSEDVDWDLPGSAATSFLLAHGEHDLAVPIEHARAAAKALVRAGAAVDCVTHAGGHDLPTPAAAEVASWLTRVGGGTAGGGHLGTK